MTREELRKRLESLIASDDLERGGDELVDQLLLSDHPSEAVPEILRCMEDHPAADYGSPGPLVHFVERFYKKGYEAELVASIQRRATPHTLWMLNRVINGTQEPNEKAGFIKVMLDVEQNRELGEDTKRAVRQFLGLHA